MALQLARHGPGEGEHRSSVPAALLQCRFKKGVSMHRHLLIALAVIMSTARAATWEQVSDNLWASIPFYGLSGSWYTDLVGTLYTDPTTGHLLAFPNRYDTYVSEDLGETWTVVQPSGRGRFALQSISMNNLNGDFVVWRIDGPSALIYNDLNASRPIKPTGQGYTTGAVDWSQNPPMDLLGKQHHSSKIHLSRDGGVNWSLFKEGTEKGGMLTINCIVYHLDGQVHLTRDIGQTSTVVASFTPNVEWPVTYGDEMFWTTENGLYVSRDSCETWQKVDGPWNTSYPKYGPYFGGSAEVFVVVSAAGVYKTTDAGDTWKKIADYHAPDGAERTHWGWDHIRNVLYVAGHCGEMYRLELGPVSVRPEMSTPAARVGTTPRGRTALFDMRGARVKNAGARCPSPGAYVARPADQNKGDGSAVPLLIAR